MKATVYPARAHGAVRSVGSKSHAARLLILSSLCDSPTRVTGVSFCDDMAAATDCLNALCADIAYDGSDVIVTPRERTNGCVLNCRESASVLRFLLPLAAALGAEARFVLGDSLKRRPIAPLIEQLSSHGAQVRGDTLARGKLRAGEFHLPGNVSSQFVSGLCMALPLLSDDSVIVIDGELQSRGYVELTLDALRRFGIREGFAGNCIKISGGGRFVSPGTIGVQGDWSNSAMLLCCGAIGGDVTIAGLEAGSAQPDRAIVKILGDMGADISSDASGVRVRGGNLSGRVIDVSGTPDIAPAIAVAAIYAKGETVLTGASRLRLKESDRVKATVRALNDIGARAATRGDDIVIKGTGRIEGGTADCRNDHRIAMMIASAAAAAKNPVTVLGAQSVGKSYPAFFDDMRSIGFTIREDE